MLIATYTTGCSSTSIKYKTPLLEQVVLKSALDTDLFFASTVNQDLRKASVANNEELTRLIDATWQKDFDEAFARIAKNSGSFKSISKNYYSAVPDRGVMDISLEVRPNQNFGSAMITLFSLGLIPAYSSTDYSISCNYNHNGKKQSFSLEETTATWIGWFVTGSSPNVNDYRLKEKKVFENFSSHILKRCSENFDIGK